MSMQCAACGFKANVLKEMAQHKAQVHGDRALLEKLDAAAKGKKASE